MLWHVVGSSDRVVFYWSVVEVVRVSRVALFVSFVLFVGGLVFWVWHPFLMVGGLLAFYFSVMYVQIVGFINAAPSVAASRVLLLFFVGGVVASLWVGFLAFLPFSIFYALLYLRGVGRRPGLAPNFLTVAGILLLPTASSYVEVLATFPLGSVYSLLYRIDGARARRRYSVGGALFLTFVYVAAYFAYKFGVSWAFFVPSLVLTLLVPPRLGDLYGVGSFLFRWGAASVFVDTHVFYMSFAVVMSVLCVPFFVPAVIYRGVPRYGVWLFLLVSAGAAFRVFGLLELAALFVLASIFFVVYKSYREGRVELEAPPT